MSSAFEHLDLIEKAVKKPRFGLIADVDGTISKTAPTPKLAQVSSACHHYMAILCRHQALVALVSSR